MAQGVQRAHEVQEDRGCSDTDYLDLQNSEEEALVCRLLKQPQQPPLRQRLQYLGEYSHLPWDPAEQPIQLWVYLL